MHTHFFHQLTLHLHLAAPDAGGTAPANHTTNGYGGALALILLVVALTALAVLVLITIGINRRRRALNNRPVPPDPAGDPWSMAAQRLQSQPRDAGDDEDDDDDQTALRDRRSS